MMGNYFLKGLPIGMANTLPGISGGTIALVLGIYDDLVQAIKKMDWRYLLPVGAGIAVGIISTSFLTSYLFESYPNEVLSFLLGLIAISTLILIKKEQVYNRASLTWLILGLLISYFMTNIEIGIRWKSVQFPLYFLGGFISTGAMILPGISGAMSLVLLGIYDEVIHAVTVFDLYILLPFGIGVILGFGIFASFISYLLTKQRTRTMGLIVGLILGSLPALWPKWSFYGFLLFVLGAIGAYFLRARTKAKD